jgi:hypothetical protein
MPFSPEFRKQLLDAAAALTPDQIASLSREDLAAIEAIRAEDTASAGVSFREFLSSLDFCDLALSPLVAAIADASDGVRPTTIGEAECQQPDGKLVDVRVRAAGARGKGGRAFTLVFAGWTRRASSTTRRASSTIGDLPRDVSARRARRAGLDRLDAHGSKASVCSRRCSRKNWGTHDQHSVVRGVGTRALNPTWDPDGEIEKELREDDPDNAEREIDAKPLTSGSQHFFSLEAIEAAAVNEKRPQRLERDPDALYGAGGDCAFKRNSSALAVVALRDARPSSRPSRSSSRLPGLPLKPEAVVDHFAPVLKDYGVAALTVDAHERADGGARARAPPALGGARRPRRSRATCFARKRCTRASVELPKHPRLARQLRDVVSKPQPGGGHAITSPKKADGSHGDLVSALVNAVWRAVHGAPVSLSALDKYRSKLPRTRV